MLEEMGNQQKEWIINIMKISKGKGQCIDICQRSTPCLYWKHETIQGKYISKHRKLLCSHKGFRRYLSVKEV